MTVAALEGDPFIDCYRAWLKEKQFSSGTGADFLSSFTQTSGKAPLHSDIDHFLRCRSTQHTLVN